MSDAAIQDTGGLEGPSTSWATAGVLLRQARVSAGVHVDALAAVLKVPAYKIEALEDDRLDVFPDVVFVRALASSICRTLKVEASPVLDLLPQGQPARLPADRGINTAFKDVHAGKKASVSSIGGRGSTRWVPTIVIVLLLAAVALVFLPRGVEQWLKGSRDEASSASPADATPGQIVEKAVPLKAASSSESPALAESVVSPPDMSAASTPKVAEGREPVAAGPSLTSAVEANATLLIRARGETWVQIRSVADGNSVQRVLHSGESLLAPGGPPWSVVIGKAGVTDVLVRGEALDLSTIARENVARFEVK